LLIGFGFTSTSYSYKALAEPTYRTRSRGQANSDKLSHGARTARFDLGNTE